MNSDTAFCEFHCDLDGYDADSVTDQIVQAVSDFQVDRAANAPKGISVVLSGDILFIELHKALTTEERMLADTPTGVAMMRQCYRQRFPSPSDALWHEIEYITGRQMREFDTDDATHTAVIAQALRAGTLVKAFQLI